MVGRISMRLGCPPQDLALWQRGLSWHPAGLTQHIWAEESAPNGSPHSWRVHVWTWCLKRVIVSSRETVDAIASELPRNALSGLVRKPGSPSRLGFAASIRMPNDRIEWTAQLMAAVALLQVRDAIRLTQSPAVLEAGAAPDITTTGRPLDFPETPVPHMTDPRLDPAAVLHALPFAEVAERLRAHEGVRAIATVTGVTASFPVFVDNNRRDFIMLEMRLAAREGLGHGVCLSMFIPSEAPAHLLHALALNEAEMGSASQTDLIGGWIVRDAALQHDAFVPWALCTGDVIRHLAQAAARRAAWLQLAGPSIVPADWPENIPGRVLPFRRRS